MQSALHITTRVLPGNKIEVQLPPGSEGEEVDVFVVLPVTASPPITQHGDTHLAEMADDPDIRAEIAAINLEFAIAQMDGLDLE